MANITESVSSNVFYIARSAAAKLNERLSSRENAAELMSIDPGRLYRIEKGLTNPYPEEAYIMADLYGAPELRNLYCKHYCKLGRNLPEVSPNLNLDRISVQAFSSLRKVGAVKELLLDIVADGVIDESEKSDLEQIISTLDELNAINQNLKCWAEKNLSGDNR